MEATNETKKWTGKRIAKLVADIVCWVFFAFALVFTVFAFTAQASNTGVPTFGSKALLTVETDSMVGENGFESGDLITIKVLPDVEDEPEERKAALSEFTATVYEGGSVKELGTVITFWADLNGDGTKELNTHRIEEIQLNFRGDGHTQFITKGDANLARDENPVFDNDVVGVWTGSCASGMGSFITFLQPPQVGFFVFIILPLAGFLAYEIVILVLTVKKMKSGDKRSITKAEEELIKQKAVEEYLKKQEAEKVASEEKASDK